MPDSLMQQVIVDNRGGGASITGTEAVVRAQPAPIIERLRNELVKAQQQPEAKERIMALGADSVRSTPADAGAFLKNETVRWAARGQGSEDTVGGLSYVDSRFSP